jgi:HNH endonuclease/NUMOD4 motif
MTDLATLPRKLEQLCLPGERWRLVVGYEGLYDVSSLGRVWSNYRGGRILKPGRHPHGYPQVGLWRDGQHRMWLVHQIVCIAFHGPRPPGMEVCHNDGVPSNVAASNLRWDTHEGNMGDKQEHGTTGIKNVCDNGHEYTPETTYWYTIKSGRKAGKRRRYCKLCVKNRAAEYHKRTYKPRKPTAA